MAIHTVEISVPGSVPSSVEIEGGFGPAVVEINQGPTGPNSVTSATTTTLNGILKGNGSVVGTATAGADYLTPTGNGSGLTNLRVTRAFIDEAERLAAAPEFQGQLAFQTDNSKLFYGINSDPGNWGSSFNWDTILATEILVSSTISAEGNITGLNLSGTNTGDQTTITGNAGTATALQTARTIFGQSFDGTADANGNLLTNGHLASVTGTAGAGHLIMSQGTAPTLVSGRTAIYGIANGFGVRDGTGTARTVALSGNISLANNLTTSGNFALTLTTTAATNVTLPTTGTLATLAGTETLSGKTLTTPIARGAGTTTGTAFTVQNSASATRAIIRDDGSYGVNGYIPSAHAPTSGYAGVWMDSSNSGVIGETTSNFKGVYMVANVARAGGAWTQQDTARNSFIFSLGYEANNNGLSLLRAAAGSGNTFSTFFAVDGTTGGLTLQKTITAAGTTGARTINQPTGSVNFAAGATSLVVTNSLVSTSSVIMVTMASNDATAAGLRVVAGAGSFTIHLMTAPTAEMRVNFLVTN